MRFYTTIKLGPNRSLTPEGFTLFSNVSIARTGEQIYGPGETQIPPGPDGLVHIDRKPEEVFRPETLASANGKPLVIDHPEEDVRPHNWRYLAHGVMLNARRGTGEQQNETVADILVYTDEALAAIDSGKREVSLGYDADYFQTGEGRGEQRNIIINHIAELEAGRCGGRCAIKDKKHKGACTMKKSFKDRLLEAFTSKDESAFKKIAEEIPEEGSGAATHIHVHTVDKAKDEEEDPTEKRFKKIEDCLEKLSKDKARDDESEEEKTAREKKEKEASDKARDEEAEKERKKAEDAESEEIAEEVDDEEKEEVKKAKDSALLSKAFDDVKMKAEIIAPGVKLPTFDSAAKPNKTFRDCICGLRRKALQLGTSDAATAAIIDQVRGKATDGAIFLKMPCKDVRTVFNSVAALKKAENNVAVTRDSSNTSKARDEKELTPTQKFKAASDKRWGIGQK